MIIIINIKNTKLTEAVRPSKTATDQTASNISHINYALHKYRD